MCLNNGEVDRSAAMLTDAQVRKIKPAEKKTKYSDEKGMYLEVTPSGGYALVYEISNSW